MELKAKYQDEIFSLMSKILREPKMDEIYLNELINTAVSLAGGYEKMSDEIEIGISNGYPLDTQLAMLELIFKKT